MDKDRGTDCRGGAARHSAAWLPVIRTSCSLLFQAICVLSARIPAGADDLCFKKNVPVRSQLREDTCQGAAATQRNAGVGFSSLDRKSTRLNSSHASKSRMPSSA